LPDPGGGNFKEGNILNVIFIFIFLFETKTVRVSLEHLLTPRRALRWQAAPKVNRTSIEAQ